MQIVQLIYKTAEHCVFDTKHQVSHNETKKSNMSQSPKPDLIVLVLVYGTN